MTMEAYAPPRDLGSKLRRRMTQWRASQPCRLEFNEPILSITFDDFPASAAREGASVLEAHGARGTYYAAAALCERPGPSGVNFSATDIQRLVSAGHEIGCHSYSHLNAVERDVFTSLEDLAKNRDVLMQMGAPSPRAHAYPYGETTNRLKDGLPPRFASGRGIIRGLNHGPSDLAQLHAYAMFGQDWSQRLTTALTRAVKRKAWVIAFTHDIGDAPSAWGTRAADLEMLIRDAHRLGFAVLPVSAALDRRLA